MNALQVHDKIYYAGKIDDREVSFHRAILKKGTTYNSYLLASEKPTVIDTVDPQFGKEFIENLNKLIDPASIQYIISNHVEPDHSGAIPALAARAQRARIVCTRKAEPILRDMFKLHNREFLIVKDGDTLDIGGKVLKFFETPYLHTEETMLTYDQQAGILFPCDVFSAHIAAHQVFNDITDVNYDEDFKVYYDLIMSPHRPYVRKMLEKIKDLNINIIAPSHGYVHRKDPMKYVSLYDKWSDKGVSTKDKKVLIVYSTMTGNTARIAERIARGMLELDIVPQIFNLVNSDRDEVKKKILECDGVLFGSSTRYGDMVGNIEDFVKSFNQENLKDKFAAAFGSFGWSGESIAYLDEQLEKMGFNVINYRYMVQKLGRDESVFPLRIRFIRSEELDRAEEAGRIFAEQVLTR